MGVFAGIGSIIGNFLPTIQVGLGPDYTFYGFGSFVMLVTFVLCYGLKDVVKEDRNLRKKSSISHSDLQLQ